MTQHRSYWLEEALTYDTHHCPPLVGEHKTDVCIIGGGYVGLWSAIRIKELDPACHVTIIEKDICGGGASGRNGGFALSWWPKISSLAKLCGQQEALAIARESVAAIEEIDSFCQKHNFDVHFRKSPWLWTATSQVQMDAWESVMQVCEKLGVTAFEHVSDQEVARRTGSSAHRSGVIDKSAATLQPALLARGLRRIALQMGVQIFENTKMLKFTRTNPLQIKVSQGQIATKKIIIASNAWAAGIKELSRAIVAITSDMIMTEPAADDLNKIGWTGGECITDSQTMVDYYHVSKGHRIAFGKGGWGIAYGGCLGADFDRNRKRAQTVEADFRRYYPALKHIKVTHDWCGPIDRTPHSLPLLGRFRHNPNIIYGVGWSGNGVGPSVIGGKILASLALDRQDRWAEHPLIGKSPGTFPPEPIRFIGAHVVRTAVACKEKAEIQDQKPSWLSVQISKLAPAGLEDKV